eukprot:Rhum_TRINITY_DN12132_c0_g1::Rhum_TRINITY_DN12132_c0_g1_i1::g.49563::m.49563/K00882/fruK; 1-phosphofructokinase
MSQSTTRPDCDKPIKCAVSYLIYSADRTSFVAVQRPDSDADLPGVWGLPAGMHDGTLRSWEESVVVSGKQKLGVTLGNLRELSTGYTERAAYVLEMKQFEATVMDVPPGSDDAAVAAAVSCPQPVAGVTQYQRWAWGPHHVLREAAQRGSLCSRLHLDGAGVAWAPVEAPPADAGYLTICLNPTLQKTLVFDAFRIGGVNRAVQSYVDVSGKGVHVSRVLTQLGEAPVVHLTQVAADGLFRSLVHKEGFEVRSVPAAVEARTCTTVINRGAEASVTELVEEGAAVAPGVLEETLLLVERAVGCGSVHTLVASGSTAPGFGDDVYAKVTRAAKAASPPVTVVLDIRGAPLRGALPHRPDYVKVNAEEFAVTFLPEEAQAAAREGEAPTAELVAAMSKAALEVRTAHGSTCVVTAGAHGAFYFDDAAGGLVHAPAVAGVSVANTIGCGDAFTAGFAAGLRKGQSVAEAVAEGQKAAAKCAEQIRPGTIA